MTKSRFFLVRLDPDLEPFRANGLFHAIALHPGVEAVFSADLTGLSRERLELLTGPAVQPTQGELFAEVRVA